MEVGSLFIFFHSFFLFLFLLVDFSNVGVLSLCSPRYELLLRELGRYTPPEDAESQSIENALTKIKKINSHVNECKRAIENTQKLTVIQSKIKNNPESIFAPHRKLIRHDELVKDGAKLEFLLFSDVLVWIDSSFNCKGWLNLGDVVLEPLAEKVNIAKDNKNTGKDQDIKLALVTGNVIFIHPILLISNTVPLVYCLLRSVFSLLEHHYRNQTQEN